jgi:GTPase SAR1 family protein
VRDEYFKNPPTVLDNHLLKLQFHGQEINLQTWDQSPNDEFDSIRALSHKNTDAFLLCSAISEPNSFVNVEGK